MKAAKPTNMAASVRARLVNMSRASGEDFTYVLTRYSLERLLARPPSPCPPSPAQRSSGYVASSLTLVPGDSLSRPKRRCFDSELRWARRVRKRFAGSRRKCVGPPSLSRSHYGRVGASRRARVRLRPARNAERRLVAAKESGRGLGDGPGLPGPFKRKAARA